MDNNLSQSPREDGCKCKAQPPDVEGRNLIVCIDGASNQSGDKNTNVMELYSQLVKDDARQLTYYNSGIGTYAKPYWRSVSYLIQVLCNKIAFAIAWNFEKIIMDAYRWLADNYRDGDRIYLFGFSRGAYQVRVLEEMIHKVGLIHKGNEEQIPFAYELYADPASDGNMSGTSYRMNLAQRFKDTFSRKDVRVYFIGVWDTVSSIRGPNLPRTVTLDHMCFFRHALALDERRVNFLPEYACRGVMQQSLQNAASAEHLAQQQTVKEVWFPGTHSDMRVSFYLFDIIRELTGLRRGGGSVISGDLDRRHPAFLWMSYEAAWAGLRLMYSDVAWKWDELGPINESLTSVWKLLEYLPIKRLSYESGDSVTWRPHRGRGRKIQPGQKVHVSAAYCQKSYSPKVVLPVDGTQWVGFIGLGDPEDPLSVLRDLKDIDLLEMEIFDPNAADIVMNMIESSPDKTGPLHRPAIM
ncbi:hypothetical protein BU17DRAFT_96812 [Hysterangium stoloniferum]|nr:hypothetical protein BU17DRAFT_96812 [Hysterangium stoloniferum]